MSHRMLGAGAIVAAIALGGTGMQALRYAQAQQQAAAPVTQVGRGASAGTPASLSQAFRQAANQALPSVVHVQVEGTRVQRSPFGREQAQRVAGSGSGFVIRADGYILTNNHVVEGAERVTVVTQEREEYDARVVGRDPNTDLAVLKIAASGLPAAAFTDSDAAQVGDWVVALGYPLQLGVTATAGIVSAKGRALGIIERSAEAPAPLEYFIQTDAAINPGNSGGPLVDLDGRVVGVNSAIKSETGFYAGYGFSVPANLARKVSEDLIAYGEVRRPKIGVEVSEVDPVDVDVYRLKRAAGAEIVSVAAGSPAAEAGIRIGDVITAVDGEPIELSGELTERLALMKPGTTVRMELVRYGERRQVSVKLGSFEAPRLAGAAPAPVAARAAGEARLGFAAVELTPRLAAQAAFPREQKGVLITQGFGEFNGSLIESINGRKVESVRDVEAVAAELKPGSAISLILRNAGGERRIVNYRARS